MGRASCACGTQPIGWATRVCPGVDNYTGDSTVASAGNRLSYPVEYEYDGTSRLIRGKVDSCDSFATPTC
ncbi:MAG: hypothetical protein Fues2KO_18230 [Fuerstiella sp.]